MPGTPEQPEYLKAQVSMPPSFVLENPNSRPHIATIVQLFLEHVGVPTVASWTHRARACNWSLTQSGNIPAPSGGFLPLIPNPSPHTSHYVFRGHLAGWRPSVNSTVTSVSRPTTFPSSSQESVYDIDEITMDDTTMSLITAYEKIAELEGDLKSNDAHLLETETQTDILRGVMADYEAMQTDLCTHVRNLTDENARLEQENTQL